MQINSPISLLSRTVSTINNPNLPVGTLIEEIPTDLGRSYAGYKRGGVIEGLEKLRKELMAAVVWMAGIPAFNKLGNFFCEKFGSIPMGIDYSNVTEGKDCIKNSVKFLTGEYNENSAEIKGMDVSALLKYGDKFKGLDSNALIKNVKTAKQVTSISAVVINCLAMGVILPKLNQKMTRNLVEKNKKNNDSTSSFVSLDEFKKNVNQEKTDNKITFKGLDKTVYNIENNNRFRLIITDIPMIIGRVMTSRNPYEALETVVMDGASMFFYNFSSELIQKQMRNLTKTPEISPKIAELLTNSEPETILNAMKKVNSNEKINNLQELLLDNDLAKNIYEEGTYGRYNKINKFVKNSELSEIDNNIVNFLKFVQTEAKKQGSEIVNQDGSLNKDLLTNLTKKANRKNAGFLALGLGISILGLAVIVPKLAFWITKKLTGKDEFVANIEVKKEDKTSKS